jgi:hypothetical protein
MAMAAGSSINKAANSRNQTTIVGPATFNWENCVCDKKFIETTTTRGDLRSRQ